MDKYNNYNQYRQKMNCSRGDIILADLRFSDFSGSKVRPALVVQSNHQRQAG